MVANLGIFTTSNKCEFKTIFFSSDYHMFVDVGLDATANSEMTFQLMVGNLQ